MSSSAPVLPNLRRAAAVAAVGAVAATVAALAVATPADAVGTAQSQVVVAVPSTATPDVHNGTVIAITSNGHRIVVGGSFSKVSDPGASAEMTRRRLLAFDSTTGAVDRHFHPDLNGTVDALWPGPNRRTVFVVGSFTTVNGHHRRGLVKLNLETGRRVKSFHVPALDGPAYGVQMAAGRLFVTGAFTHVGSKARAGLAAINPVTGALSGYLKVALTGHHNYRHSPDAKGKVGGRDLDVSPDGRRLMVIGNFKHADGHRHDQIVKIDLRRHRAVVDPHWNTAAFSARCGSTGFDSYVRHVQYSPDGTYFVVTATGAGTLTTNSDGSRSNCDAASRFAASSKSSRALPTWVDRTGDDTLIGLAVTGTAVYVGGHQRWLNNDLANDTAGPGSVPRPGLAALDPVNGLPLAWDPGRNPRGEGAYAVYATAAGLYVGSDTDYFGDRAYRRERLGFFPLAGGSTPASTATGKLPANLYVPGPTGTSGASTDSLIYRAYTSSAAIGAATTVAGTGVSWSKTRGAFMVGSTIYFGAADGTLQKSSFDGTTVGARVAVDPYRDPKWSGVDTGSGQTYRGVRPSYFAEIPSLTSAFYLKGKLYYTRAGKKDLYWRYFTPDSGIVGAAENLATAGHVNFANITGAFAHGQALYYVTGHGNLHQTSIHKDVVGRADTLLSGPKHGGINWAGRGLFAFRGPTTPIRPTSTVAFRSSTDGYAAPPSGGGGSSVTLTTPTVVTGDTELLFASASVSGATVTPTGWTLIRRQTSDPLETSVFRRTADSADAGTPVLVTTTAGAVSAQLLDYAGVGSAALVTAGVSDDISYVNPTKHTTPAVPITVPGSWVVSFWVDKTSSSPPSRWTLPASVRARRATPATGANRVDAVVADTNRPAGTGSYRPLTASVSAQSGRGVDISVVLAPQH